MKKIKRVIIVLLVLVGCYQIMTFTNNQAYKKALESCENGEVIKTHTELGDIFYICKK